MARRPTLTALSSHPAVSRGLTSRLCSYQGSFQHAVSASRDGGRPSQGRCRELGWRCTGHQRGPSRLLGARVEKVRGLYPGPGVATAPRAPKCWANLSVVWALKKVFVMW